MSEQLTLDAARMEAAELALRKAVDVLREAEIGTSFLFLSVTGIAEIVCRFLVNLDLHLSGLTSVVAESMRTVTLVADEAAVLDRQLAGVIPVGFVSPREGG